MIVESHNGKEYLVVAADLEKIERAIQFFDITELYEYLLISKDGNATLETCVGTSTNLTRENKPGFEIIDYWSVAIEHQEVETQEVETQSEKKVKKSVNKLKKTLNKTIDDLLKVEYEKLNKIRNNQTVKQSKRVILASIKKLKALKVNK